MYNLLKIFIDIYNSKYCKPFKNKMNSYCNKRCEYYKYCKILFFINRNRDIINLDYDYVYDIYINNNLNYSYYGIPINV